mmetsp:Transcript_38372/g.123056  ORF Transcript_38372/g.123056 Transcript_38372/m.123056 type:complete len:230 (-) Transcript_38372:575-1264(-)
MYRRVPPVSVGRRAVAAVFQRLLRLVVPDDVFFFFHAAVRPADGQHENSTRLVGRRREHVRWRCLCGLHAEPETRRLSGAPPPLEHYFLVRPRRLGGDERRRVPPRRETLRARPALEQPLGVFRLVLPARQRRRLPRRRRGVLRRPLRTSFQKKLARKTRRRHRPTRRRTLVPLLALQNQNVGLRRLHRPRRPQTRRRRRRRYTEHNKPRRTTNLGKVAPRLSRLRREY